MGDVMLPLIGYSLLLAISGTLAVVLYVWLRVVWRSQLFYMICGVLAVTACVLPISLVCASGPTLIAIESYGTPDDIISRMVCAYIFGSAFFELSPPVVACLLAFPFLVALCLVIRFRIYGSQPECPRTNRLVLGIGLMVLSTLGVLVTRNVIHVAMMKERVGTMKAIGAECGVHRGAMEIVVFRRGRPRLDIVAKQHGLKALCLRGCDVRDEDIQFLTGLGHLEEIDLTDTPITDKCIPSIEAIPSLRIVRISGTGISAKGAEQLRREYSRKPKRPG